MNVMHSTSICKLYWSNLVTIFPRMYYADTRQISFRRVSCTELYGPFSPCGLKIILTLFFQLLYPFALLSRFFLVRCLFFREAFNYSRLNLERSYTRVGHYLSYVRVDILFLETSKVREV